MIHIENLRVIRQGKTLLNVPSLVVHEGDKVAVIGPSGSGKSTLLSVIARDVIDYEGSVTVAGKVLPKDRNLRIYAKSLAYIRQEDVMISSLSVLNNVIIGKLGQWGLMKALFHLILPFDKKAVQKVLEGVHMADRMHSPVDKLSGGERQRIAIARAIIQETPILVADEPVSALDPHLAHQMIDLITELGEARTLIASLHNVKLALTSFDYVLGLKEGEVAFYLPKDAVTKESVRKLYERHEE